MHLNHTDIWAKFQGNLLLLTLPLCYRHEGASTQWCSALFKIHLNIFPAVKSNVANSDLTACFLDTVVLKSQHTKTTCGKLYLFLRQPAIKHPYLFLAWLAPQENTRTAINVQRSKTTAPPSPWKVVGRTRFLHLEFNYVGFENQTSAVFELMFRTGTTAIECVWVHNYTMAT